MAAPLAFGHKHYVPVLKSKQGEFWAVRHLSDAAKDAITPLFDLLPDTSVSAHQRVGNLIRSLASAWQNRPAFVDTRHFGTQSQSHVQVLNAAFQAARSRSLLGIPVTSIGRSPAFQSAVAAISAQDGRGVMLRLEVQDFTNAVQFAAALTALPGVLGVQPNEVDILVDYGGLQSGATLQQLMRVHIPAVVQIAPWRTLSTACGSFPDSISHLPTGSWHQLIREEWNGWYSALTNGPSLPRRPSFGDYGIRGPGVPPAFGRASANLRYTCTGDYLVRRGATLQQGGGTQMRGICQSLISRSEYSGNTFSAGDAQIAVIAATPGSSGNPQQWTQWCMNHHFAFVVQQIANAPGI